MNPLDSFLLAVATFISKSNLSETILTCANFISSHTIGLFILVCVSSILFVFFRQVYMFILVRITHKQGNATKNESERVFHQGYAKRILILGDSTAFGTGADTQEETLAGRFAHDFPHVEIVNRAVNGSTTNNVITQLQGVDDRSYNLTIISTGGNDTWKMTSYASIEHDLKISIEHAMRITGKNVVLIIYNNIASGPIFPIGIRSIITRRTNVINDIFIRVGKMYGIETVPIFLEGEKCPKNFFSRDGLHPSSEGYRIMYIRLWATLYQYRYNYKLRDY